VSKVVQEKFQINYPQEDNDNPHGGWITDMEARGKKGLEGREGSPGGDGASRPMNNAVFHMSLPPGSDIEDQENADIRRMDLVSASEYGQVVRDVNQTSLRKGFDRKAMLSTDDMYTREHNDAFYDVVEADGVEGFLERNNYLDRS
jgi:hypothetical protein